MHPLGSATLTSLADSLSVPGYDRSEVRAGIVHLGVGAFHRSHQAMYVDRLVTGTYALAQAEDALTAGRRDPASVKVVVHPQA